ncbi:transposase, partial [Elizabethkingia anophelis]
MSRPEIVIQKKSIVMEEKPNYVKRTQKDYSLTLKIQIVKEVESGALSTL